MVATTLALRFPGRVHRPRLLLLACVVAASIRCGGSDGVAEDRCVALCDEHPRLAEHHDCVCETGDDERTDDDEDDER